jgi:hypothetical protein
VVGLVCDARVIKLVQRKQLARAHGGLRESVDLHQKNFLPAPPLSPPPFGPLFFLVSIPPPRRKKLAHSCNCTLPLFSNQAFLSP